MKKLIEDIKDNSVFIIYLLVILLVLFLSSCERNPVLELEITYLDGSKEIVFTKHYFSREYVNILKNTCTENIYDENRCGVRSVKILKTY